MGYEENNRLTDSNNEFELTAYMQLHRTPQALAERLQNEKIQDTLSSTAS